MSEPLHLKVHSRNNKKSSSSGSRNRKRGFGYSGDVSSFDSARKSSPQKVHTLSHRLGKSNSNKIKKFQWAFGDNASFESSFLHKGEQSPEKYDDNKIENFPSFSKAAKSKAISFQSPSFTTANKGEKSRHDSQSEWRMVR